MSWDPMLWEGVRERERERERETVSQDHEKVPGFMGKIAIKIKFADILSAALWQHHLSGFWIAHWGFHHLHYQKQDLELTVAQIMSSLLQNSGLNWRK